jgi:hypothetical protein
MNGTDWLVQRMNTLPSADNFHHQGCVLMEYSDSMHPVIRQR